MVAALERAHGCDGRFDVQRRVPSLKVLEGSAPAIKATYGHISCDSRSSEPKLLAFEQASAREFPNWAMAYVDEDKQTDVDLVSFRNAVRSEDGQAIGSHTALASRPAGCQSSGMMTAVGLRRGSGRGKRAMCR